MDKRVSGNNIENGDRDDNELRDVVWILPFMMLGAMFGSLAGAGIGHAMGQSTPFGSALIGIFAGMLFVGALGLLVTQSIRSG